MTIYILGRQPLIGLAELERVFGSSKVHHIAPEVAAVDAPPLPRPIGSALKIADELARFQDSHFAAISKRTVDYLFKNLPTDGKVTLGISAYNFQSSSHDIQKVGLAIKQKRKRNSFSTRLVPNKEPALNSAQVLHNKLTSSHKWEILLIRTFQNEVILAKTNHVQDITEYTKRDRGRPKRDARVGMLPPKLAQTIINLAVGSLEPEKDDVVLDPFCGTGVILQEASLMGFGIYGSDIDKRMVEYTDENLRWVAQHNKKLHARSKDGRYYKLEVADAANHTWPYFSAIACETYLGQPFSSEPSDEILKEVIYDCNSIHKKFLNNIAKQTKSGLPLCIAVPAWHVRGRIYHLPVLDDLNNLGYNRLDFTRASNEDLIYYREGQIVGRELLVLIRR